jgi:hypothetical protein
LKNFGFADEVTVVAAGINGKMSEINAAFGLLQLKGIDEEGRDIVIPDNRILEVMNTVQQSYNFATGFDAPVLTPQTYFDNMVNQTIERIVYDVSNTLQIEQCNMKKTIWTTVLGDFNKEKLQGHSQIKIRNKHPTFMLNMRY